MGEFAFHFAAQCFLANAQPREQRKDHSVRLIGQRREQMQGRNFLIFMAGGNFVRGLQSFLGFYG